MNVKLTLNGNGIAHHLHGTTSDILQIEVIAGFSIVCSEEVRDVLWNTAEATSRKGCEET